MVEQNQVLQRIAALAGIGLLAISGPWIATHFVADIFGHQQALGAPLLSFGDARLYPPFAIFEWNERFAAHYPRPFAVAGLILCAGFAAAGAALWLFVKLTSLKRAFGAKAWATRADVSAAGLLAKHGLVLGRFGRDILCAKPEGHFLLIGPSRKGKGRSHVVPTLLTWPHSALVADLIDRDPTPQPGAYYGLMSFFAKLTLALAAGLALPLLDLWGYRPGGDQLLALSATYALLPIVMKLGALAWFWRRTGRSAGRSL
jgi:hypothetical protein